MTDTEVLAFVGSLRSGSVNAATARAAIELAPEAMAITIHPIADIPLFNEDLEESGAPDSVVELHRAVAAADAVLFFLPEYNGSLPAVGKNIIDWLSREPNSLEGKPLAGVATTPGSRAGAGVLGHFEQIFDHMLAEYPRFESFGIGRYYEKFSDVPELTDEETRTALAEWLVGFAEFAGQ